MKTLRILAIVATLGATALAQEKVGFTPDDTIASVLTRQKDKRVELVLKSGEKLTGTIAGVGSKTVHVQALAGREFFDAVVAIDDISAVVIRTGGK